ncbi:4-hydroxy-3-methylbut-2-enyl diphosphate reductase [Streptomyces sp. NPDC002092]
MGKVLLAVPRGFCAGVERAVDTVAQALERHGPPVYVRPTDRAKRSRRAVVVLSAHGVSPAVHRQAADRGLQVIDATCPLVTKVHKEAVRFARDGYTIALIGHDDHEEVEGTRAEAPDAIHTIATVEEAENLQVPDGELLVWLSQTTLAVDEVTAVAATLRRRFPELADPPGDDICYATQNRQDAVRAMAPRCDLLLVVGSANSSNSVRLVEVALRVGAKAAHLLDDADQLDHAWLAGARCIGVTAGASAPESAVSGLLHALAGHGYTDVEEVAVTQETLHFALRSQLRKDTDTS